MNHNGMKKFGTDEALRKKNSETAQAINRDLQNNRLSQSYEWVSSSDEDAKFELEFPKLSKSTGLYILIASRILISLISYILKSLFTV